MLAGAFQCGGQGYGAYKALSQGDRIDSALNQLALAELKEESSSSLPKTASVVPPRIGLGIWPTSLMDQYSPNGRNGAVEYNPFLTKM